MTFIPPSDDPSPNKGRAAPAFMFGLASLGSGAAVGVSRRPREKARADPPTRRQHIEVTVTMLTVYACWALGAVLGWHMHPSLLGIAVGLFIGAGAGLLIGALLSVFALVLRGRDWGAR